MLMQDFGAKLKKRRKELGITQTELAKMVGMTTSNISRYETGAIKDIQLNMLDKLASALKITPLELLNWDTDFKPVRFSDTKYAYIDVYGTVPAGTPIEAVEDIIGEVEIPVSMFRGGKDFIALKVKGSSMYPRYIEGDIVVVELTSDFTSGQDVVVYVNGYEATLKKIYKNDDGTITLKPINPEYMEMTYGPGDEQIQVLGVVRKLMRDI